MPFVVWTFVMLVFSAGFLCGVSFAAADILPMLACSAVVLCLLVILALAQKLVERRRVIARMQRQWVAELQRPPRPRERSQWRGPAMVPRALVSAAEAAADRGAGGQRPQVVGGDAA